LSLLHFAWRNILGDRYRSLAVSSCAAIVAGLALLATFLVRGAEAGLHQNLQRMGADVMVLPWGTITDKIGGVRMVSAAIDGWMPRAYMEKIRAVAGVAQVSPQLYLATLEDTPHGSGPEIKLVAFDPSTDFTLLPWADQPEAIRELQLWGAVVGSNLNHLDLGNNLQLVGFNFQVIGRLEATGSDIDRTVFVSFETAEQMATASLDWATPFEFSSDKISAVMVAARLGYSSDEIAVRILEQVPGVVPLQTPNLYQTERGHMIGVLRTLLSTLLGIWGLAVLFIGLVFTIVVNERQREIGVLRALGSPRRFIQQSLLLEGTLMAIAGGTAGLLLTGLFLFSLGENLARTLSLPLVMPTPLDLASLSVFGQLLTVGSVALAASLPAWLASRKEAALAMRD
jgi:putative ABC transport system permease protein